MEDRELVTAGSFCWNTACRDYGRTEAGNLVRFGYTAKGVQRYRCRTCGRTFAQTRGSLFYGLRHDPNEVLECLALLAERNSLAAISRVKGIKEETLSEWVRRAAAHVEPIETVLISRYRLHRVQLDALWTYVGHKGEKGGGARRPKEAASGVEWPSVVTHGCG